MKKFVRGSILLAALIALGACNNNPAPSKDEVAPMLTGVQTTLTCEAGTELDLLSGITAIDDVDGDITNKITVSTMPELTVTNGVIAPSLDETGFYDVTYTVTDNAGNEAVAFSELNITEAFGAKELIYTWDFNVGAQGWDPYINEGVTGTHGVAGGKYVFDITEGTGTDWHIKYAYYNYEVKAGHSYEIKASLISNVAGTVKFNGADKQIKVGHNELTTLIETRVDTTNNIELQFGLLTGPFKVELESIKIFDSFKSVDEEKTVPVNTLKAAVLVNDGWKFNNEWHTEYSSGDGVVGKLETTETAATVTQESNGPGWAGKFILQTKRVLTGGKTYHVSVTYKASETVTDLEFGYGTWGDDFKKYHERYGVTLEGGVETVLDFVTTPDADIDNPFVCLKMGGVAAGVSITATNFVITTEGEETEIDFSAAGVANAWSETGRNSLTETTKTSVKTTLTGNAEDPYKASTDIELKGINLSNSATYRIKLDVASSTNIDRVALMMGKPEWDPTSLFTTGETITLNANETKTITAFASSESGLTDLKIRVKYGTAVDGTVFTVSNLVVEKVEYVIADAINLLPSDYSYGGANVARGDGDHAPTVTTTENSAIYTSTFAGDCWLAFAILEARVELHVGTKYHIAIDIESSAEISGLEVGAGYRDGDFKQIGHHYEVKFNAGEKRTFEFTYICDTEFADTWGIGVHMGTVPVGETLTFSNLVVESVPNAVNSEETAYVFTPKGVGHYANEEAGAKSEVYVEDGVLVYDIISLSHESDWYNKFFISDIELEGGARYIFELVVKADTVLNGSLLLNKQGAWDVRAQNAFTLTTEWQTITLETDLLTAPITFELLFQDLHQNTSVNSAKIYFQSISLYQQVTA